MLSSDDILRAVFNGDVSLTPFDSNLIQPSSIDVRLDSEFLVFDRNEYGAIDPEEQQQMVPVSVGKHMPFVLGPGEFALASTYEAVRLGPGMAARLEGKSSLGRLGLLTHATAGFIDPGFDGHVTLELANLTHRPLKLWPGMKIGQLCFFRLDSPTSQPYGTEKNGSHYQGQRGPTASRSHEGFLVKDIYRQF